MARPLRIEYEGALYHVTARGNERRKTFFSHRDYEKFLDYLDEARGKFAIIVHGYVLMTNHYHLIIETPQANLSRVMHHVNGSYTTYLNIKRARSGHLFQGRFKSIVVDRDCYLLELSRYLHLNPVRAQIVERPEQYRYSSYCNYIGSRSDPRITTSSILEMMAGGDGNGRDAYRSFVESAIGKEVENPMEKVYGSAILGREDFIETILKKVAAEKRGKTEISYRKALSATIFPGRIITAIHQRYWIPEGEALPREIKLLCLYLLKRNTSASNGEIGEMVGGMGAAAVAKAYQRYVRKMEQDKEMAKEVGQMEEEVSRVKG